MAKKPKEVIEEVKDVVESEVETAKESIAVLFTKAIEDLEKMKADFSEFEIEHHNKPVIDLATREAIKALDVVLGGAKFIEKALLEKKK